MDRCYTQEVAISPTTTAAEFLSAVSKVPDDEYVVLRINGPEGQEASDLMVWFARHPRVVSIMPGSPVVRGQLIREKIISPRPEHRRR